MQQLPVLDTLTEFHNWNHTAVSRPAVVVVPQTVEALTEIVCDPAKSPSPVRPAGHFHSMNDSISTPGTQVLMNHFTGIEVDLQAGTITVGAFVSLLEIHRALQPFDMQIEVSPEIGNATAGSVACCGTKDASIGPHGLGQVSSCVVAMKLVNAKGEIEAASMMKDPARMHVLRCSYGLLGIVFEVTFRIQKQVLLQQRFTSFKLNPLPEIRELFDDADGVLALCLPYSNLLMVERRKIVPGNTPRTRRSEQVLRLRNTLWENGVSYFSTRVARNGFYNLLDQGFKLMLQSFDALGGFTSYRNESTLDFKFDREHFFDFTFWGIPVSQWTQFMPQYVQFCQAYLSTTGYRMNLPAEVYFLRQDQHSLLSFSEHEDVFTMDLVVSRPNDPNWIGFNQQFNRFVAEFGARPLLNQTKQLTREVVMRCLGAVWTQFCTLREQEDMDGRFLSPYFQSLLSN